MLWFSAFMSLMHAAIFAVILAAFTQHDLIVALAGDPDLNYDEMDRCLAAGMQAGILVRKFTFST